MFQTQFNIFSLLISEDLISWDVESHLSLKIIVDRKEALTGALLIALHNEVRLHLLS